jgi:hypothetical protein
MTNKQKKRYLNCLEQANKEELVRLILRWLDYKEDLDGYNMNDLERDLKSVKEQMEYEKKEAVKSEEQKWKDMKEWVYQMQVWLDHRLAEIENGETILIYEEGSDTGWRNENQDDFEKYYENLEEISTPVSIAGEYVKSCCLLEKYEQAIEVAERVLNLKIQAENEYDPSEFIFTLEDFSSDQRAEEFHLETLLIYYILSCIAAKREDVYEVYYSICTKRYPGEGVSVEDLFEQAGKNKQLVQDFLIQWKTYLQNSDLSRASYLLKEADKIHVA